MIVGTDEGVYRLTDVSKALNPDYSGWEKVGAPDDMLVIVDSLDSTATDKALSANQGRVLMGEINTLAAKLTGIYSYKGSITTYEELPTDAKAGDVWNVEEKVGSHAAGTNWAWTGEAWDALAGSIDLSAYFTAEEVNAAIEVEKVRAEAKEAELLVLIENNATGISEAKAGIASNLTLIDSITKSVGEINELNIEQTERISALEELIHGNGEGLEGGMSMAHPATLVRSDVIKSHKFDTSFKIAADYNMMLDLYNQNYEFFKLQTVISQFQTDGISSTNFEASIKEAGRAKLNHGYAYDEEKEISAAVEGANRKRRNLPKFVRKFWNKNIKKRLWIEE
jgi:hypothetical protein